jgi:hypothetical protein
MRVRPILTSPSSRLLEPQLGLDANGNLVRSKVKGMGDMLDVDAPTFGWRDIHAQTTNTGTKNKAPDFWA